MVAKIRIAVIVAALLGLVGTGCTPELPPIEAKVLAFYYPWYGTPWVSGAWIHWNEGDHDPDIIGPGGRRDIGATNYPARDVYDSNDPAVLDAHIADAEAAGIDAFIASWWGVGDFTDQAFAALLDRIEARGSTVRACPYYENVPGESAENALADLLFILDQYGTREAFFRVDGRPVLFIYGRAMGQLSSGDWNWIIEQVRLTHDAFFSADASVHSASAPGAFEAVHFYNPCGLIDQGQDMEALYSSFVFQARLKGNYSAITVIPGYDDSNIGRPNPIIVPRHDGLLYENLWSWAIQAGPHWVLITSYNEWHEGSEIEASLEYGGDYVDATRPQSDLFKGM